MDKKSYYRAETEFASGEGIVYSEFMGEIATRQINIVDGVYYSSSTLQEWNDAVGYLLYDGKKSDLDLSDSVLISEAEFEAEWAKSITESDLNAFIHNHFGDASVPLNKSTLIIHVVNNCGKWGKGFVLALAKKYPNAKKAYLEWGKSGYTMGDVQFLLEDEVNQIFIANMVAQDGIKKSMKDEKKYISYESLEHCLSKVADFALAKRLVIQLPLIGAGLGGGNWEEIMDIILRKLAYKKIHCHIVRLP